MAWWHNSPLRMIEICETLNLRTALDEQARLVERLGGNVQHFHCMDHSAHDDDSGGMNDEGFYFNTGLARAQHPDRLAAYLPIAHARGIRVVVYVNVHWISREFGGRHPAWRQVKENGEPVMELYNTATSFCINTPYREWIFQLLRDLCRYEIDGIFFDGPLFFANTCYCEACQRLFHERIGQQLPLKSDRQDSRWREMIAFQVASLNRFLADSDRVVKACNPDIALYDNGNGLSPDWARGHRNREAIQQMDLLAAEGGYMYGDLNQAVYLYNAGATARLLSTQAGGKPAGVFITTEHGPWTFAMQQQHELGHLLAQTLAGGAHYFISAIFPENLHSSSLEVLAEYGRLVADHPDAFHGTSSAARIALLWPAVSADGYPSSLPLTDFTQQIETEGVGNIFREFHGMYHALAFSQAPFDVIDEQALEGLSRYQLLVLPNAGCLSASAARQIRDYVRQGGNLIATFDTSHFDEQGIRQEDFQLADVLGVHSSGSPFGPMRWDYISPPASSASPLLEGIDAEFIPSPTYGNPVTLEDGHAVLFFRERMRGRIDGVPPISTQPCLVEHRFGNGTAVYCAATLGETILEFRFPEYLTLIRNLVNRLSAPPVNLKGAPWVEVSLRRKGTTVYLHLINQTTGPRRPMIAVQPVCMLPIHVAGQLITSASSLRHGCPLTIQHEAEGSTIILDRLDGYDVLALEGWV